MSLCRTIPVFMITCFFIEVSCVVPARAQQPTKLDTSYVTPNACVMAGLRVENLLTSKDAEFLPREIFTAAGKQHLGIDPMDVVQIVAMLEVGEQGPQAGLVAHFSKPHSLDNILKPLVEQTVEGQINGKPYRQGQGPMGLSLFMPNDKTLLIGSDPLLPKMLANHERPADGPLRTLISRINIPTDLVVVGVVEPVRDMLTQQLDSAPVPPPFDGLKKLPQLLNAAKIDLKPTGVPYVSIALLGTNEQSAMELEKMINGLIDMGRQMTLAQMAENMQGDEEDPIQAASTQYMQRISQHMFDSMRPTRTGSVLKLHQSGQQYSVASTGLLLGMMIPAIQSAKSATVRLDASNNMRQFVLAMHLYHDINRHLPTRASFDANGKPLLSWRVHVLPFLDQKQLYDQFHLDEPWDSEHNKKLIPLMPEVFRNPSSNLAEPGKTVYQVPVGPGTLFEGQKKLTFGAITDGSSNTIMVLEVNDDHAVTWTAPEDWKFDPANPSSGLGGAHKDGSHIGNADGSVFFVLKDALDPEVLKGAFTIAGGEQVSVGDLVR